MPVLKHSCSQVSDWGRRPSTDTHLQISLPGKMAMSGGGREKERGRERERECTCRGVYTFIVFAIVNLMA